MPCRALVDGIDPLCPDSRRFADMDAWLDAIRDWANEHFKEAEGATNMRQLLHGKVFPLDEIGYDHRLYCFAEEGSNEGFYITLVLHERHRYGTAEGKIHTLLSIKTLGNVRSAAPIVHDLTLAIHSVKDP